MSDVILQRGEDGDWGTKGVWTITDSGWTCDGLELPNRGNMPGISRIPAATYSCSLIWSGHFQMMLYQVNDVPGRGNIEIHPGNWAGDLGKGLFSNVRGCALQGRGYGDIAPHRGQVALLNSAVTVAQFIKEMEGRSFTLEVKAAQNGGAG